MVSMYLLYVSRNAWHPCIVVFFACHVHVSSVCWCVMSHIACFSQLSGHGNSFSVVVPFFPLGIAVLLAEFGEWSRAQDLATHSLLYSEAAGLCHSMGRCYRAKLRLALMEGKLEVANQFAQLACRQPGDVSTWVSIVQEMIGALLEREEYRQIREVFIVPFLSMLLLPSCGHPTLLHVCAWLSIVLVRSI